MTSAIPPERAFVGSSAFYSLVDPGDGEHNRAVRISGRLSREGWRLFTTNFVVAETHGLIVRRVGRRPALTFLEDVMLSPALVLRVREDDEATGLAIIRRYRDKEFSMTDATSFAVMERLRLHWAFSFDSDFRQYGWNIFA